MRLFQAADAIQLTGLTRSQLREWTGRGRRGLISPDVEPDGPGRHALYSWQTLLVLRLLRLLHNDFAAEVAAWSPAANVLRTKLDGFSFPGLWGMSAFFRDRETAALLDDPSELSSGGIVIPLDPHLSVLAMKLSLPRAAQLSLFPPMLVTR